ncbi:MAG: threonine synthase [Anaerolineales bacterium]
MKSEYNYKCSLCGHEYDTQEIIYTCPRDSGNLDVILDYSNIREALSPDQIKKSREPSIWRYLALLPIGEPIGAGTPLHSVGWTPVYSPDSLSEKLDLRDLFIKDESPNPTASFKDRASAVVVAKAIEIGKEVVVTASTGNAGAALAGMAAAVSQKAVIMAPKNAPPAKIAQLLIYNAQVILVDGRYDDAFDLSIQASQEFGWYCRNTGFNPFTAEGKKTAAFEIWEWFENHKNTSVKNMEELAVFVSVGDGNIISGIHKGFKDLLALDWIETPPRIFGVQAAGSAAIANAFNQKSEQIQPVSADTIADSISVDMPRDGVRAVRAASQTNGSYITVEDREIIRAIKDLGEAGIFAEPAGAASFAGLKIALKSGLVDRSTPVLVINTGSGLKDINAARKAVSQPLIIQPTLEDLKKAVN